MGRRKREPRRAKLGRPPGAMVPIERHPQRFEIACVWAFRRFGLGPFDAARRALLVVRSGPISMADIEGVLRLAQTSVPLPEAEDEPNAAERRLFAKAARQRPEPWLLQSSAFIQTLVISVRTDNVTGACLCLDNLLALGWRPVITGLHERISRMLESNVPPADLTSLGPAARRTGPVGLIDG
ncbi:MAG: hypothetical protein ACJ8C9_16905 [Microvirga sp.]|jgi:hypothetical protein